MIEALIAATGAVLAALVLSSPVLYQVSRMRKENSSQHGATGDGLQEVNQAIIGLTNEVRTLTEATRFNGIAIQEHVHDSRVHIS